MEISRMISYVKGAVARKRKQFKFELHNEGMSETIVCAMCMRIVRVYARAHRWSDFPDNAHPKTFASAGDHCIPMTFTQPIRFEYWNLLAFFKKIGAKIISVQLCF